MKFDHLEFAELIGSARPALAEFFGVDLATLKPWSFRSNSWNGTWPGERRNLMPWKIGQTSTGGQCRLESRLGAMLASITA